jgi:hypothetical protein
MTFRDLSNIIRRHKDSNNTTTIIDPVQKEVEEARALWQLLKKLHDEAHQQREQEWLERHPGKEFYQRTNEDDRRDCTFDEWIFDFIQELQ